MNDGDVPKIDKPISVSDENFGRTIKSYRAMVVDFWASWCAPCRRVAPVIDQLAKEYSGRVVFGKMNVDESPETPAKFGVMSIPTMVMIRNGEEVDRIVGVVTVDDMRTAIGRALSE